MKNLLKRGSKLSKMQNYASFLLAHHKLKKKKKKVLMSICKQQKKNAFCYRLFLLLFCQYDCRSILSKDYHLKQWILHLDFLLQLQEKFQLKLQKKICKLVKFLNLLNSFAPLRYLNFPTGHRFPVYLPVQKLLNIHFQENPRHFVFLEN